MSGRSQAIAGENPQGWGRIYEDVLEFLKPPGWGGNFGFLLMDSARAAEPEG